MPNSFPMTGRATFTEETMNGVRNEARTATSNAVRFVAASCMIVTTFLFGSGTRCYWRTCMSRLIGSMPAPNGTCRSGTG